MEQIQNQIVEINKKVDGLYQVIEHLSNEISEFAKDKPDLSPQTKGKFPSIGQLKQVQQTKQDRNELLMAHKDIINDDSSWESYSDYDSEKNLSPEIQIRRLTAQLTAAYNRIATLEEQLVARRIHF